MSDLVPCPRCDGAKLGCALCDHPDGLCPAHRAMYYVLRGGPTHVERLGSRERHEFRGRPSIEQALEAARKFP